jgi:hypothetical protein
MNTSDCKVMSTQETATSSMESGVGIDHGILGQKGAEHPVMIERRPRRLLEPHLSVMSPACASGDRIRLQTYLSR